MSVRERLRISIQESNRDDCVMISDGIRGAERLMKDAVCEVDRFEYLEPVVQK